MKTSKNDITGDLLSTKVASEDYRANYDAIFRKPVVVEEPIEDVTLKQPDDK